MKKNFIFAFLLLSAFILASCSGALFPAPTEEPTPEPTATPEPVLRALIIVGNEFGNTYFDMKTELEAVGFIVDTAGVGGKELLSSCPNHEDIPITPDCDITEITEENINDYQVVFVPAGKHHRSIQYSKDVRRVLTLSKDNGLCISAVCAGNIVLAAVDGLIEGHEIACSSATKSYIESAGATPKYINVVVDGQFVTGSTSGGNHAKAPTRKMAEEIKKLITNS
ncbi:MAG: DJ-1/PfpI family protein [Clostridia bacterium]|nr:DJ-1/PfpI family protein [Clostridia bacterium]